MFHQLDKVEPMCAPDRTMKSIEIMDYLSCWEILALGLSCLFKMLGVQFDLQIGFPQDRTMVFPRSFPFSVGVFPFFLGVLCV